MPNPKICKSATRRLQTHTHPKPHLIYSPLLYRLSYGESFGGTPGVGIEPTTTRLKAERSAAELTGINTYLTDRLR